MRFTMADDRNVELQTKMKAAGFYTGEVDGKWGPLSKAAYAAYEASLTATSDMSIAWSAKVSPAFAERVIEICKLLKMDEDGPNKLMSCMAWETGETFSPTVKNGAGSTAVGLIQFMKATALALGTTRDAMLLMSDLEQLDYVYEYFKPFTGKIKTIADVYMVILYPKAVGKPEDYVLFDSVDSALAYRQNVGVDLNHDGKVTKLEAAMCVQKKYDAGMKAINRKVKV